MEKFDGEWAGRITISNPVNLINEIARRYSTLERVIMEYIDNSLDDADDAAKSNNNTYPYPISIDVVIDKTRQSILIRDNCRGMELTTLSRIVHNIGESQKRLCPWLNGQFGFGVHAFRGFCQEIFFRTKHVNDKHYLLAMKRDNLWVPRPRIEQGEFFSASKAGTVVTLEKFDEDIFDGVTAEAIKEEIESHFEAMLRKDNVRIRVGYRDEKLLNCRPYDYSKIPGKVFQATENISLYDTTYPLEIFLKVADIPVSKTPRFFAKGRRVLSVNEDKSFIGKSKYRTFVWNHNNLTGYIEVGELVSPVITRDGFKRGKNRTILYDTILRFEEDLKKAIDDINKKYEDHNLNKIEDAISKVIRKLAKEYSLKFMPDHVVGGQETHLAPGGGSDTTDNAGGTTHTGTGTIVNPGGTEEGSGDGPSGSSSGPTQGAGSDGPLPESGDSDYTGHRAKKSGFAIKFLRLPPDAEGNVLRSQFNNGVISINMEHPDFEKRIKRTHQGALKIEDRLISYLAAVISIHYKDQYYEKYRNQPDVRTELFDQQVDFIFKLESALAPFLKEIDDILFKDTQT